MEYLAILDGIARGQPQTVPVRDPSGGDKPLTRQVVPSDRDRITAAIALLEIGHGQLRNVTLTGDDGESTAFDLSRLTHDEVMTVLALVAKARGSGNG